MIAHEQQSLLFVLSYMIFATISSLPQAPVFMPAVGVATLCFALIRALPLLSPGTNTPSRHTLLTLCFALIRALPLLSPGTNTPSRHTL